MKTEIVSKVGPVPGYQIPKESPVYKELIAELETACTNLHALNRTIARQGPVITESRHLPYDEILQPFPARTIQKERAEQGFDLAQMTIGRQCPVVSDFEEIKIAGYERFEAAQKRLALLIAEYNFPNDELLRNKAVRDIMWQLPAGDPEKRQLAQALQGQRSLRGQMELERPLLPGEISFSAVKEMLGALDSVKPQVEAADPLLKRSELRYAAIKEFAWFLSTRLPAGGTPAVFVFEARRMYDDLKTGKDNAVNQKLDSHLAERGLLEWQGRAKTALCFERDIKTLAAACTEADFTQKVIEQLAKRQ